MCSHHSSLHVFNNICDETKKQTLLKRTKQLIAHIHNIILTFVTNQKSKRSEKNLQLAFVSSQHSYQNKQFWSNKKQKKELDN